MCRLSTKSESVFTQLFPTLCDHMDCRSSGSTVHGILQARIAEWIAISFSRGSSRPRDWTLVSCITGRLFTNWTTRKPYKSLSICMYGENVCFSCSKPQQFEFSSSSAKHCTWGSSGCDICYPIDFQGWLGWSGCLTGCLLPPYPLHHTCPSWSSMLVEGDLPGYWSIFLRSDICR